MSGGEELKKRREELHLEIKDIADKLKIKADYLRFIENNSFCKLPVPVYTKGYIRCYAQYLGLDPEPLINHYMTEFQQSIKQSISTPGEVPQEKSKSYFYSVIILLLGAFAFLYFSSRHEDRSFFGKDEVKKSRKEQPAVIIPPIEEEKKTSQSQESTPEKEDEKIIPPVQDSSSRQSPNVIGQTSVDDKHVSNTKDHLLKLEAVEKVWFSIRFKDGHSSEGLMRPGETLSRNFEDFIFLRVGNAGGVNVVLDGKNLGKLGKPGEVLTVKFPETAGPN